MTRSGATAHLSFHPVEEQLVRGTSLAMYPPVMETDMRRHDHDRILGTPA
jgi:hypothetical protein